MGRSTSVLCLSILLAALLMATPSDASEYVLSPLADAHVYSGAPGVNDGTQFFMVTEYYQAGGPSYIYSYLKFDLTGIPGNEAIIGARLYLYQLPLIHKGDGLGTSLYRISSDNWTETGITWNNQPSDTGILLDTKNLVNSVGWNYWNLFQIQGWNPGTDQGDGVLSLRLTEGQSGILESHYFYSREYTNQSFKPYLEITTAPVPIPAALYLLGSGLLGLVALRRRMKRTSSQGLIPVRSYKA